MRYRKRPVVIDAFKWNGAGFVLPLPLWVTEAVSEGRIRRNDEVDRTQLIVETLEDGGTQVRHIASAGDWIIKGIKGELYPCKPDIFAATYEAVGE